MTSTVPPDEPLRLAALASYSPGPDLGDRALDDLVELAAQICDTPIALVTLVGADRQDFAARRGLNAQGTPRDIAFCAHAIERPDEPLIVEDATTDPRFADNPLVTADPHIRSYAGFPLVGAENQPLGTLCVIDRRPRRLSPAQTLQLKTLARAAVAHLEVRKTSLLLQAGRRQLAGVLNVAADAFIAMDGHGIVRGWNPAAERLFGYFEADALGRRVSALIIPPGLAEQHDAGVERLLRTGTSQVLGRPIELEARHRDGRALEIELTIGRLQNDGEVLFNAFARDISARKATARALEQERSFNAAVLEAVQTSVIACDAEGKLSLFNRAARELHGVDASAVGADQWAARYDLFAPDGRTPLQAHEIPLARAYAGEEVRDELMVVGRAEDVMATLSVSGGPVVDGAGRKLGAVVAMHDLTERLEQERARREADLRFRTVFDAAPIGMVMVDLDGRFVRANAAIERITGYSADELGTLPPFAFVHPDDLSDVQTRFALVGQESETSKMTHRIVRADGAVSWVTAHVTMLRDAAETPATVLAQINDITEQYRAERELTEQHAFTSAIVETADSLVVVLDRDGVITTFNRACEALTGRACAGVVGRCLWDVGVLPDDERHDVQSVFDDILHGEFPHHFVNHWQNTRGEKRLVEWRSTALTDDSGTVTHVVATGIDITERRELEDRLRHMADHDPLTGLVNRRRFELELEKHLARCRRHGPTGALMVLDVDGLKDVNDTYGHGVGDTLIIGVADALRARLREIDVVARLGGDEFAVLLPDATDGDSRHVAAELVRVVRDQAGPKGGRAPFHATTSLGVLVFDDSAELVAESAIVAADVAMYAAKAAGGDRYAVFAGRAPETSGTPG